MNETVARPAGKGPGLKFTFLALLAAAAAASYLTYSHNIETAVLDAEGELRSIHSLKERDVEDWLEERLFDARRVSHNYLLGEALRREMRSPGGSRAALDGTADGFLTHPDYAGVVFYDTAGGRLHAKGRGSGRLAWSSDPCFKTAVSERTQCLSSARLDPGGGVLLGVFTPAFRGEDSKGPAGIVLLIADLDERLFRDIQAWPMLSRTAEALLAVRNGGDALFLNTPRHAAVAPLSMRLPLSTPGLPMTAALRGESRFMAGLDYRGEPVFSVTSAIAHTGWGMVTKIDRAEALTEARLRSVVVAGAFFAAAILIFAGIMAAAAWQERRHGLQLARLKDYYDNFIRNAAEFFLLLTPDGRVVEANDTACRFYGYSREEMGALNFADLFPEEGREAAASALATALKDGDAALEAGQTRRGGGIFPAEIRARAAGAGGERVVHVIIRDITERRRAEEEKEKISLALKVKNKELEDFLYVTTHDLRSPLVNVQGFAQNLREYLSGLREAALSPEGAAALKDNFLRLYEERIPAALDFISGGADKMDRLITALLRISRMGRAQLNTTPQDMNALAAQAVSFFSFKAGQIGAEIKAGPLPPCLADRESVSQILSNLLENALKYRHPDRPPRVELSGRLEDGRAVYEVRDNGLGIDQAHLEKIWQVFYRVDPRNGAGGEGIGLSLVRTLAEKNAGTISARSTPGEGSVFILELPAAPERPAHDTEEL